MLVSTPRENIGASMLIAEELEPSLGVPVEVVPMEELESVLESSSNGTVVTSRYFLQPLKELAKNTACALSPSTSTTSAASWRCSRIASGQLRGLSNISPGILRAAK